MMILKRKPEWIRYRIPSGDGYLKIRSTVARYRLHTICIEGGCPNAGECFGRSTATFLIMGSICTRDCLYCAVSKGKPEQPDYSEPQRVADAVSDLEIKHAVITSVTRDDITDGGAGIFSETVSRIRVKNPGCTVELLVPDFKLSMKKSLDAIRGSDPDILNHNIEAAKTIYPSVRPSGDYRLSLDLLKYASDYGMRTKSGIMAGFGETMKDIKDTLDELAETGCETVTVGQYLNPVKGGYEVRKYYHPDEFDMIRDYAIRAGFVTVLSAPNVRSSYHAQEIIKGV